VGFPEVLDAGDATRECIICGKRVAGRTRVFYSRVF
jgi:hypothetical protein